MCSQNNNDAISRNELNTKISESINEIKDKDNDYNRGKLDAYNSVLETIKGLSALKPPQRPNK